MKLTKVSVVSDQKKSCLQFFMTFTVIRQLHGM
uniref:Uncharacterized protein n=1 Tax=Arundo donax TaxID=35708 RepID=A0A0A8ZH18_ARUDO